MDDYENIKANLKSEGYHLCNGWLQSNATEINLSKLNFNDFELIFLLSILLFSKK